MRWNEAIFATVFSMEHGGRPAYLDMDDAVLEAAGARLAVAADDARGAFLEAVRGTVDLGGGASGVFRQHLRQLDAWRRRVARAGSASASVVEPPPTLGLLAAFTLAAEAMGSDKLAAVHAYYPRLAGVLGATGEKAKERLEMAYQTCAERLWRSLNDWLVLADGRYGTPTAHALTHRYVGLPLSQALVRDADRRHLVQMFRQFGLPPGSVMAPADMERVLDSWISQVPCPASKNLQGLWQRADARERIAEVAATELAEWESTNDDAASDDAGSRPGSIQLLSQLRPFPRTGLHLSFLTSLPGASTPDEVTVDDVEGQRPVPMLALGGGRLRPRSAENIDPGSLLDGLLHVTDPQSGAEVKRYPRPVVPLRKDEGASAFVECERVQLGEDFQVLVKDEGALLVEVRALLSSTARPGFVVHSTLHGLPMGWVLISDVQVLAAPSSSKTQRPALNPLVPLVASHLSMAGGLKLPGNLRKWSSARPPEVRAVSQLDSDLELTLVRADAASGESSSQEVWRSRDGVVLVDLNEVDLDDGDYEFTLSGRGRALQRVVLRLRSSDTPDRWSWANAPELHDDRCAPRAALSAAAGPHAGPQGRPSDRSGEPVVVPASIGTIWWTPPPRVASTITPIVIAAPEPTSCVVTGAHRIQLPPTPKGRPTSPMFSGECLQCGLVKRYPAWPKRRRQTHDVSTLELDRPRDVSEVSSVAVTHDDALDALVHVGGGPSSSLERVLAQVDPSALAIDTFRRALEALGHVELQRDDRLELESWRLTAPAILRAGDGTFFLTGAWSSRARATLETHVDEAGGAFTHVEHRSGPMTWFIEDLSTEEIETILPSLAQDLPDRTTPSLATDPATGLVSALPALSKIEAALARIPMPGAQQISRFDVGTASWQPVQSAVAPGAYRLESSFRTRYVYRSERDVTQQEAAVCSPQLAKHLEALRAGRPLLAYYPKPQQLAVPSGAELPVLYGRATVWNSGRLPGVSRKARATVYGEVPESFAAQLFALFSS